MEYQRLVLEAFDQGNGVCEYYLYLRAVAIPFPFMRSIKHLGCGYGRKQLSWTAFWHSFHVLKGRPYKGKDTGRGLPTTLP
jgi:hypothetical protein